MGICQQADAALDMGQLQIVDLAVRNSPAAPLKVPKSLVYESKLYLLDVVAQFADSRTF